MIRPAATACLLAALGSCAGQPLTDREIGRLCEELSSQHPITLQELAVELESPEFSGEFTGILLLAFTGDDLDLRFQLFPEVGGKVADILFKSRGVDLGPTTPSIETAILTSLRSVHRRLRPEDVLRATRDEDTVRLDLRPLGGRHCRLELRDGAKERRYRLSAPGMVWDLIVAESGDVTAKAGRFFMAVRIESTEHPDAIPEGAFR